MRRSGSPESPYHLTGRAEEKVERLIRSEEPQLQKFSNLCLLVGLLICGVHWLFGLLWPSLSLNGSIVTDLILLVAMAHSFVYRKEKQALAFVGVYWMTEFIVALNTVGQGFAQASKTFTSSLYTTFSNILMLFFALYILAAAFEPLTYRRQKFYHTFKPILKLVTVLVLIICLLLGIIGFFGGIRLNYLSLTSLVYLLGSTLMLAVISREFDREAWMRPIKRLGLPLFLAVLAVFSLIQGILQFAVLYKTVAVPGFLLFLFPILKLFFSAVFVVPVYLLLAWGFRYPVRVRATERNHITGSENEEAQDVDATMQSMAAEGEAMQNMAPYADPSAQAYAAPNYDAQTYGQPAYGAVRAEMGYAAQPEGEMNQEYSPLQGGQQPHEAWSPLGAAGAPSAQQESQVLDWNASSNRGGWEGQPGDAQQVEPMQAPQYPQQPQQAQPSQESQQSQQQVRWQRIVPQDGTSTEQTDRT